MQYNILIICAHFQSCVYLHNAVSDLWREKLEHCWVLNPLSGFQSDAHPSSEASRRVGWVGLVATCGKEYIYCSYSCMSSNEILCTLMYNWHPFTNYKAIVMGTFVLLHIHHRYSINTTFQMYTALLVAPDHNLYTILCVYIGLAMTEHSYITHL